MINIARKYRQIIVLAIASIAIAAYVIPFNWGSVTETQAQQSPYEDLIDNLNEAEENVQESIDESDENTPPSADERHDDARDRVSDRFDTARQRVADSRIGESGSSEQQSNSEELNIAEESDGDTNDEKNANTNDEDNDERNAGDEIRDRANEQRESARN